MSLDVKLIDGSPRADAAHPPLSGGSGGGVGINESILDDLVGVPDFIKFTFYFLQLAGRKFV